MNKESEHKAFDNFFKERYGEHKLNAPEELWEKVHSITTDSNVTGFDKILQDRYTDDKIIPPKFLWRRISLHNSSNSTFFFHKYLSHITWIGIIFLSGIIGMKLYQTIFNNANEAKSDIPSKVQRHDIESMEDSMSIPTDNKLQEENETTMPEKEALPNINAEKNDLYEYATTENFVNEDKITSEVETTISESSIYEETKDESIATNNQAKKTNELFNNNETTTNNTLKDQKIATFSQNIKSINENLDLIDNREKNMQIEALQTDIPNKDNKSDAEWTSEIKNSENTHIETSKYQSEHVNNIEIMVMNSDTSEITINEKNKNNNGPIGTKNQAKGTNQVSNEILIDKSTNIQEIKQSGDKVNNRIESYELSELNNEINTLQSDTTKNENSDKFKLISKIPDSNITNIEETESEQDINAKTIISKINSDTTAYKFSKSGWSLSAFMAPTCSFRQLIGPYEGGVNGFYNNNHNGNWHFSGNIRTAYHFNKKWSLNFGLGYNKLSQRLDFRTVNPNEFPNISLDGVNKIITVYSSLNTAISEVLDFFEFTYPGGDPNNPNDYAPINYREEYKFKFLTIPITARYLLGNKKIKGIVDLGIQATLNISDLSLIQISSASQPEETVIFENYHNINTYGLQFITGLGIQYNLKSRISLILLPNFNYSLLNLNNHDYSTIKPYDISLSSGILFRF